MNMSYCRFQNTRKDLRDCIDALDDCHDISKAEADAGRRMFKGFLDFCVRYAIIEEYDEQAIEELFDERTEEQ